MFIESKCLKCGRIFVPAPYHVYKNDKGYFCSWTCYNHRNDGVISKRKMRKVEQYSIDGKFIREFNGITQAAQFVGANTNTIKKACQKPMGMCRKSLWKYKDSKEG